jgi:hypothetical protein
MSSGNIKIGIFEIKRKLQMKIKVIIYILLSISLFILSACPGLFEY